MAHWTGRVTLEWVFKNRIFNENRQHQEQHCNQDTHNDDSMVMDNFEAKEFCLRQAGFLLDEMEDENRPGHLMIQAERLRMRNWRNVRLRLR